MTFDYFLMHTTFCVVPFVCIFTRFVLFKPKDVVSGDFYWMHKLQNEVLIAVADCTGHGVPGAMVSLVCSNALNRCVKEFGLTPSSRAKVNAIEHASQTPDIKIEKH